MIDSGNEMHMREVERIRTKVICLTKFILTHTHTQSHLLCFVHLMYETLLELQKWHLSNNSRQAKYTFSHQNVYDVAVLFLFKFYM